MPGPDLLHDWAAPLIDGVAGLAPAATPAVLRTYARDLVEVGAAAAVLAAAGGLAAVLGRRAGTGAATGAGAILAGLALLLLGWIAGHPSTTSELLLGRWDHIVFVALAGAVLRLASPAMRVWALALVSLLFVATLAGPLALAISLATVALSWVAVHATRARPVGTLVAAEAAILVAATATCWQVHLAHPLLGIQAQGLFAFVLLRVVSFVVDVRRGLAVSPAEAVWYLFFYPSCYGATEPCAEFLERNRTSADAAPATVLRAFVVGGVLIVTAKALPSMFDSLEQAPTLLVAWASMLAVYVRSALYLMGLWSIIDAVGLLWTVRLAPNFAGLLRVENPSQFWGSWRATMTRWLVCYVYIPLGGNRRAQVRNVWAVFAVSGAWHVFGVPFLSTPMQPIEVVPVLTWAAANAAGVSAYVVARRLRWRVLPEATPVLVRRTLHRIGAMAFGSITAVFLSFYGARAAAFPSLVARLLGLP